MEGYSTKMERRSKVIRRILLGTFLILLLILIFSLDWYLWSNTESVFWRSGGVILIATAILMIWAGKELERIARLLGIEPHSPILFFLIISILTFSFIRTDTLTITIPMGLFLIFLFQILRSDTIRAFENITASSFEILYLALLPSFWLILRRDYGPFVLISLIAVVKSTDIGAYFSGTFLGRTKLIPQISAGKTLEGLLGGLITAGFVSYFTLSYIPCIVSVPSPFCNKIPFLPSFIFGLLTGLIGQLGDLAESLLKRSASVKDSSSLIPEFGGILDLVDSLLPSGFIWFLVIKYTLQALQ